MKFYRKIRKRLISDHKLNRYLIYALGEIVLVVIGILIALQINNWNEQRKNQNKDKVLLSQLLEENNANHFELTEDANRDALVLKMFAFSDFLKTGGIEHKSTQLKSHLSILLQATSYTFSENYLYSYINSNLQGNPMLTRELVELHSNQKDLAYISEKAFNNRLENFFQVLAKDVDFRTLEIHSYETLNSFEFRNKITLMSLIESEVGQQFKKTMAQQTKVDSIITSLLME
tara:strand:- start:65 stop:760 length:696 start_codon:yes stop_codon:yes gene_type:complete